METILEVFSPGFLLRNAVYTSLLVGLVCPLVGVFLVLRRMVFLGVALPQISSTGIALAFSLHIWFGHADDAHTLSEPTLAFLGSSTFALLAIVWLAWLERRGRVPIEGRIGTAFVVATAVSILLLAKCPTAERGWLNLLKGEIIAISNADLALTFGVFLVVTAVLGLFRKEFLLVSFDREMAITLHKRVALWDLFLYLLMALTISVAVLSVGPLITFGFLLLPPLIAHQWARSMKELAVAASAIGAGSALAGFAIAYRLDLPVGPTDVALLGVLYALTLAGRRLLLWVRRPALSAGA